MEDKIKEEIIKQNNLVNEKQSPATHQLEFDGNNLTSGVYFYRLETGSFTETKRMLMTK